jgi:menaquinone-9 beta-reductase
VTEHITPAARNGSASHRGATPLAAPRDAHGAVPRRPGDEADVIVVGAGPAGSTTAYYLAQAGLDVLLLEKSRFPREKVCGDGLTPRGVKALVGMGISVTEQDGWVRNKGLRVIGAGKRMELSWPELSSYPGYGLVRHRNDLDEMLARRAQQAGARLLEGMAVTAPVIDDRTGRITGVMARPYDEEGAEGAGPSRERGSPAREYRARVIVAADGNSSRLSVAMGLRKRDDRPLGVAVRTYYQTPRHDDDYLESWLDLWDGDRLLPGYGWIFGMGDGTSNVGLGLLNTSAAFGHTDYHALLRRWLKGMPAEWGFTEENRTQPVRGAALPMGFNRTPHYSNGLLLVGDAGGMVNPFNGEGIAYAMESGELLARTIAQALARERRAETERVLAGYPRALSEAYGGYYALGRGFVKAIGQPGLMRFATRHSMARPALMRFALKLLANLTDPRGDATDRIVSGLSKLAPNPE